MIDLRVATPADVALCRRYDRWIADGALEERIAGGNVFVAIRDGRAVGYLRLGWLWAWHPFIELIVVDEPARGKGIGTAMVERLIEHLGRGRYRVLLSSAQADEPDPQRWHRHAGFVECGVVQGVNWNGADEVFFRRTLDG